MVRVSVPTFGAWYKSQLTSSGFKQVDVARYVADQTGSKVESVKVRISSIINGDGTSPEMVKMMARAIGINEKAALDEAGFGRRNPLDNKVKMISDEIAAYIASMDERTQYKAKEILRTLAA